jgi:hypothetical protein
MPADIQERITKIFNTACRAQREDVAQQNIALRKDDRAAAGLITRTTCRPPEWPPTRSPSV